jgi:hypothetical protein
MASSYIGPLLFKLADTVEELSNKCRLQADTIDFKSTTISALKYRIDELNKELASLRG